MEDISNSTWSTAKEKVLSTISYQRTANVKPQSDAIGIVEIRQTTLNTGKCLEQLDVCGSMKGTTRSEDYLEDLCLFIQ